MLIKENFTQEEKQEIIDKVKAWVEENNLKGSFITETHGEGVYIEFDYQRPLQFRYDVNKHVGTYVWNWNAYRPNMSDKENTPWHKARIDARGFAISFIKVNGELEGTAGQFGRICFYRCKNWDKLNYQIMTRRVSLIRGTRGSKEGLKLTHDDKVTMENVRHYIAHIKEWE